LKTSLLRRLWWIKVVWYIYSTRRHINGFNYQRKLWPHMVSPYLAYLERGFAPRIILTYTLLAQMIWCLKIWWRYMNTLHSDIMKLWSIDEDMKTWRYGCWLSLVCVQNLGFTWRSQSLKIEAFSVGNLTLCKCLESWCSLLTC